MRSTTWCSTTPVAVVNHSECSGSRKSGGAAYDNVGCSPVLSAAKLGRQAVGAVGRLGAFPDLTCHPNGVRFFVTLLLGRKVKTMYKKSLITLALIALLAVFGAASAQAAKVDVCHIPPGNPDNWHTITVSERAEPAHLAHGDLAGSCVANCESLCDDGNACTIDIESDPDQCVCLADPRPPVDCDDGNACTADSCDPETGACTSDSDVLACESCDDGDAGTSGEFCLEGACVGGLGPPVSDCPCEPSAFNAWYADFPPIVCSADTVCGRDVSVAILAPVSGTSFAVNLAVADFVAGDYGCFATVPGESDVQISTTPEQALACSQALRQDAADFGLTCSSP